MSHNDDDQGSASSSSIAESQHWVQCENPDCLKWRMLTREAMDDLEVEKSWFCSMNPNILYSSCDTEEEKYTSNSKMKRRGLTYKFSLLPEGSLVWAKLTGYCKWPAVICCEPGSPAYFILDEEGDPYSYHVEFLGTRHSIAWVHHAKIDAYGNLGKDEALETCSQPLSQISMNRFYGGKKRSKRRKAPRFGKKKTHLLLAQQLQSAIDEADNILDSSVEERLKNCTYRFGTGEKVIQLEAERKQAKESGCIGEKLHEAQKCSNSGQSKTTKSKAKKRKGTQSRRNKMEENLNTSQSSQHLRLPENKLNDFSSKEERLMADIKGLQSLEQEFIDDYSKYMNKETSQITGPHWQGVSVSLFQLYMAVQEKGGFNEVCANMKWKEVVMDCCESSPSSLRSSAASTAMSYYSRHLLPYEMHVRSGESGSSVTKAAKRKQAKESRKVKKKKDVHKKNKANRKTKAWSSRHARVDEDAAVRDLEEMERLLNELENRKANRKEVPADKPTDEHTKERICQLEERDVAFHYNDDSQVVKMPQAQYEKLLEETQKESQEKGGIDESELFDDAGPSQVVPQVINMDNVIPSSKSSQGSDEDLFAELDGMDQELDHFLAAMF